MWTVSNVTVCLCVSQNSTGGVGVDSNVTTVCLSVCVPKLWTVSNVTVCLCVSQNSTGGVGVDSNVTTVCLSVCVPKLDRGARAAGVRSLALRVPECADIAHACVSVRSARRARLR